MDEQQKTDIKAVPVSTTTNTVEVICVDSAANEYTFRIDNPKSNLTLQEVQNAFNIGINSNVWFSRAGYKFSSIKKAQTVYTVKQTTVLE